MPQIAALGGHCFASPRTCGRYDGANARIAQMMQNTTECNALHQVPRHADARIDYDAQDRDSMSRYFHLSNTFCRPPMRDAKCDCWRQRPTVVRRCRHLQEAGLNRFFLHRKGEGVHGPRQPWGRAAAG